MSIATVVTRGYGSFGSVALVVTRGYAIGAEVEEPASAPVPVGGGGGTISARQPPARRARPQKSPRVPHPRPPRPESQPRRGGPYVRIDEGEREEELRQEEARKRFALRFPPITEPPKPRQAPEERRGQLALADDGDSILAIGGVAVSGGARLFETDEIELTAAGLVGSDSERVRSLENEIARLKRNEAALQALLLSS